MFSFLTSYCQNKKNENELSKKLDIGIYVDNVYNIDYINSTYEIIFYLWSNSYEKIYKLDKKTIDINKSIEFEIVYEEIDSIIIENTKKFKYAAKIKAKILNKMDVSTYPFDNLVLNLDLELLGHWKGEANIQIDKKNSILNPNFIDKWKIKKTSINVTSNNWDSNFGELKNKNTTLETLHTTIILSRNSWNLYWKMFLVLFISFMMASMNLFLPNKLSEEKFALIVGTLFTAIGNKYITESYLPLSDNLNLSDCLHIITFLFISFYILYAIYEQRTKKMDCLKNDIYCFLITLILYILIVGSTTFYFIK